MSNFPETDKAVSKPLSVVFWLICVFLAISIVGTVMSVNYSHKHETKIAKQEARAAELVGEKQEPVAPIKITIKNNPSACVRVEEAYVSNGEDDTKGLKVFARRVCGTAGDYAEAHWKALSADKTILETGYTNYQIDGASKGERVEWVDNYGYVPDPRITDIVVWTPARLY